MASIPQASANSCVDREDGCYKGRLGRTSCSSPLGILYKLSTPNWRVLAGQQQHHCSLRTLWLHNLPARPPLRPHTYRHAPQRANRIHSCGPHPLQPPHPAAPHLPARPPASTPHPPAAASPSSCTARPAQPGSDVCLSRTLPAGGQQRGDV